LFPIKVFTRFNCGLVATQDISIGGVLQIGKSANGVREISKLVAMPQIGGLTNYTDF
jgi:hypothetical protein